MFTRDNIRLLMSLRLRRRMRRRSCGSQGRVVRRNDLGAPGRERNSEKARERSSERESQTGQRKIYFFHVYKSSSSPAFSCINHLFLYASFSMRHKHYKRHQRHQRVWPLGFLPASNFAKLYACLVIDVVPEVIVQHVLFGLKSLEGLSVQTYV